MPEILQHQEPRHHGAVDFGRLFVVRRDAESLQAVADWQTGRLSVVQETGSDPAAAGRACAIER
jgi:hypothetical protein